MRVDSLASSPKLPKEVDKHEFEAAKASLETMKTTWAEATAAFSAGNATEAADKAREVQDKVAEVKGQLGMNLGSHLSSESAREPRAPGLCGYLNTRWLTSDSRSR